MLFWAEGSKRRNSVVLTNSDPDLIALFVRFLRRSYGIRDDAFSFSVNCFLGNGLTLPEIENWWLERLALPRSCVRKASVNRLTGRPTA